MRLYHYSRVQYLKPLPFMMKKTCNSSICTGSSAVHHSIIEPSINIHVSNMSRRPHACALQPIQVINYGSNSRSNTFKYFIYYPRFPWFHWCYFQFFNIFRCSTLLHHSQMVVKCVQFFCHCSMLEFWCVRWHIVIVTGVYACVWLFYWYANIPPVLLATMRYTMYAAHRITS